MAFYRVFACEVLFREVCFEASQSPHRIDLSFNRFGLHDVGSEKMLAELQELVDSIQGQKYDAIIMGYGLCNNGLAELSARDIPLVIPRAHDCITLLLDSKERYESEFSKKPGTYYKSPGWIEHHHPEEEGHIIKQLGLDMSYEEMVKKYGEDNAKYLQETMGNLGTYKETYTRLAYIDTGLGPKKELVAESRSEAEKNGWQFEVLKSTRSLIRKLLWGEWDEAGFLVVRPGQAVKPSYDNMVISVK